MRGAITPCLTPYLDLELSFTLFCTDSISPLPADISAVTVVIQGRRKQNPPDLNAVPLISSTCPIASKRYMLAPKRKIEVLTEYYH